MSRFYIDLIALVWYNLIVDFLGGGVTLFNRKFIKDNLFILSCAAVTFVCVLATSIIFKQHPLKALPLFISLIVMLLNAKVNRFAFLLGGLNSLLYAASYALMGLYATAISAALTSFPLQVITFLSWNRKTREGVTELRKMSTRVRLFVTLGFVIIWPLVYFVIKSIPGANQSFLDVTGTLLGVLITIITFLRFSEYAPLNIVSAIISIITHVMIFTTDTAHITYLIYSVYSAICVTAAVVHIKKANMVK